MNESYRRIRPAEGAWVLSRHLVHDKSGIVRGSRAKGQNFKMNRAVAEPGKSPPRMESEGYREDYCRSGDLFTTDVLTRDTDLNKLCGQAMRPYLLQSGRTCKPQRKGLPLATHLCQKFWLLSVHNLDTIFLAELVLHE